jgi:hypothetical protein
VHTRFYSKVPSKIPFLKGRGGDEGGQETDRGDKEQEDNRGDNGGEETNRGDKGDKKQIRTTRGKRNKQERQGGKETGRGVVRGAIIEQVLAIFWKCNK